MTDPIAKAKALEEKAFAARRQAWDKLQTKSPDLAQFLADCQEVFGKPAWSRIEIDGNKVWETGKKP